MGVLHGGLFFISTIYLDVVIYIFCWDSLLGRFYMDYKI